MIENSCVVDNTLGFVFEGFISEAQRLFSVSQQKFFEGSPACIYDCMFIESSVGALMALGIDMWLKVFNISTKRYAFRLLLDHLSKTIRR